MPNSKSFILEKYTLRRTAEHCESRSRLRITTAGKGKAREPKEGGRGFSKVPDELAVDLTSLRDFLSTPFIMVEIREES